MSDQFVRDISRLAVGQICLTIGYNGTQVAPLDLLQDILHKFLQEMCRDLRRQVEHYNRDEANLNDMYLTLRSLNISIPELLDYVNNVEPVPFVHDIPKFPAAKRSSLNFLKPGSKEVLTRPMHIYDHLPPIEPDDSVVPTYDKKLVANNFATGKTPTDSVDVDSTAVSSDAVASSSIAHEATSLASNLESCEGQTEIPALQILKQARQEDTGALSMNSGFIPPVLEGKLPDSIIPDIIDKLEGLDAPPSDVLKPVSDTQELPSVGNPIDQLRKRGFLESANETEARRTAKTVDKSIKTAKRDTLKKGSFGGLKKNSKPNPPGASMTQGPKMVSKLLKKAKKNTATTMFLGPSKSHHSDDPNVAGAKTFDLSNKARRKQQKLLRKYFPDIDPSFVDGIPPGPERQQLEKFLKKQNKQKQKRLKQQMVLAQKNRSNAKAIGCDKKKLSVPELEKHNQMLSKNIDPLTTNEHFPSQINAHLPNTPICSLKEDLSAIPGIPEDYTDLSLNPNVAMQMKLSNEPDRSKINILKKISKQMGSDGIPPNGALSNNINALIAGSENRVINLPSGTTITPTIDGASSYEEAKPYDDQSGNTALMQQSASFAGKLNMFEGTNIGGNLIGGDKPKKRGRKPGSKNNPKSSVAYNVPEKNSKKSKLDSRSLQGVNVQPDGMFVPSVGLSAEPLNLSFVNQIEDKNSSKSLANNFPSVDDLCPQAKARKEKKKKERNIAAPTPVQIELTSDVNVPSNEEVNSINRKLSRIDTVLKPAPSPHNVNAFPSLGNELDFGVGSTLFSPTKTSGKNKRIPNMSPSNLTSFVPTSGFPIPMMPLYPFPRPGLIPTPTLFPNSVFNVNNPKKPLPNMLLPNCMPFPHIKHPTSGNMSTDNTNELSIQSGGVNCNVPRLVPEANTFLSSNSGEKLHADALPLSKMPIPSHSNENEIFPIKDGLDFDASSNAKLLLERGSESLAETSVFGNSLPSKMAGSNLMTGFGHGKAIDTMPSISLNSGDPIELSDDSLDDPQKVSSPNPSPVMKKSGTSLKSGTMISAMGMQVSNASQQSVSANLLPPGSKEAKKIKKLQKSNLKTTLPNAQLEVGKLAGGADLIPLSGTGVSYSSKTIPTTSLTASAPMQFPYMTKKDIPSCVSEITITPSVMSDVEKSSKDHKKLKKLKDGKIKKKKDKKDKLKSKERSLKEVEEATGKAIDFDKKSERGLIKKLKKEKKKEKQRKAMESGQYFPGVQTNETAFSAESSGTPDLCAPTLANAASSSVPKITLKLNTTSPSPVPPTPATDDTLQQHGKSPVGNFAAEREKEPSPELAKISPLVTRPPKQKTPGGVSNVMETVASVNDSFSGSACNPMMDSSFIPPPSPWALGGTLAANCVLLPQQLMQTTKHIDLPQPSSTSTLVSSGSDNHPNSQVTSTKSPVPVHEISRPSSYVDAEGNRVWICPACGKVDDGSAMIGCDGCDAWYHWECVGIVVAPKDNEDWFCRVCFTRKKGLGVDKKKKRNKKK